MGKMYCAKEIAAALGIDTRTLRRWVKRLKVPPTIPVHACNRWDAKAVNRIIKGMKHHAKNRTHKKANGASASHR